MKKSVFFLLALIMCLVFCSCGEVEKNDEGFITLLEKALEARWTVSEEEADPENVSTYKEFLTQCIKSELDILGSFSDYSFSDEKLEDLAQEYFSALTSQREAISYYGVDDNLFSKLFTMEGYNLRAKTIYEINKLYPLSVKEMNTGILNDMALFGSKVAAFDDLMKQDLLLENKGDSLEIILQNNTKFELSNIQLDIRLLDDSDVVVSNEVYYIDGWSAGSKTKNSVWLSIDGSDFTHAEIRIVDWNNEIATEFVPVEYKNEMIVSISIDDLPVELNYGYSNNVQTSCIINAFSYEVSGWYEGKANIEAFFSGTKTFDEEGETASNLCIFNYKIIDEQETIVDSGSVYVDTLKVNDTFKNESTYFGEIEPGNYRLILEDDMS